MKKILVLISISLSVILFACSESSKSEIEVIKLDLSKELLHPMSTADSTSFVTKSETDTLIKIYSKNNLTIIQKENLTVTSIIKMKDSIKTFVGEYYTNGQLKGKIPLNTLGEIDGDVKYFHEDGRVKGLGHFKSGKKAGVWKRFNEDGLLVSEETYN
jgi:hypothetical protein